MTRKIYTYVWFSVLMVVLGNTSNAQSIFEQLAGKIDIVVDQNGTGNYTKVQDAINAIPDSNDTWKVIFVKKGTYYEKVILGYKKTKVILVGEDVDSTIISYGDWANKMLPGGHTFSTYSFRADANEFQAYNITFQNTATSSQGQGVAFHSNGDQQILYHCRILGDQDTYFDNMRTRRYIKDCFIEGGTDFIFGFGVTLFDSCQIHSISSGYVTAASTPQYYEFGYVFRNCRLTAGVGVTSFSLGRPWFNYANTVFFECWEPTSLNSAGWTAWSGREATCFYREYNCFGPGSDTTKRVSFGKQLDPSKASRYNIDTIFAKSNFPSDMGYTVDTSELMLLYRRMEASGYAERADTILYAGRGEYLTYPTNDWFPIFDSTVLSVIKNNTVPFMDSVNGELSIDKILWDNNEIADFNPDTKYYGVEMNDTVTVAPNITVIGTGVSYSVIDPSSIPGQAKIIVRSRDKVTGTDYYLYFSKDSAYWSTEIDKIVINYEDTITIKPGIYEYDYILPPGEDDISNAMVILKYDGQNYSRVYPTEYPGVLTIDITAIDKVTTGSYTINVDLSIGISDKNMNPYKLSLMNPVQDQLILYHEFNQFISPEIKIYDLSGKMMFSSVENNLPAGISFINTDISMLKMGIYFYNITVEGKNITGKILKTN